MCENETYSVDILVVFQWYCTSFYDCIR